jgi:hypothetical protein
MSTTVPEVSSLTAPWLWGAIDLYSDSEVRSSGEVIQTPDGYLRPWPTWSENSRNIRQRLILKDLGETIEQLAQRLRLLYIPNRPEKVRDVLTGKKGVFSGFAGILDTLLTKNLGDFARPRQTMSRVYRNTSQPIHTLTRGICLSQTV